LKIRPLVIIGESDPVWVPIDEWVEYWDDLKSLPGRDESIRILLVVAEAQIQKVRQDLTSNRATS